MLTDTSVTHNITVHGTGSCQLRFLAVGGGGRGYYSGGGSGYIRYGSTTIESGSEGAVIIADVGDHKEASTISINGGMYKAESGKDRKGGDNESNQGGDGYSGGGDHSGTSEGGSDGSKGDGEDGGMGTGQDVTKYVFSAWSLSPGKGGKIHTGCTTACGGGGGGVLVDGKGPESSEYKGQGFGGGGSGASSSQFGLQGLILLELM